MPALTVRRTRCILRPGARPAWTPRRGIPVADRAGSRRRPTGLRGGARRRAGFDARTRPAGQRSGHRPDQRAGGADGAARHLAKQCGCSLASGCTARSYGALKAILEILARREEGLTLTEISIASSAHRDRPRTTSPGSRTWTRGLPAEAIQLHRSAAAGVGRTPTAARRPTIRRRPRARGAPLRRCRGCRRCRSGQPSKAPVEEPAFAMAGGPSSASSKSIEIGP